VGSWGTSAADTSRQNTSWPRFARRLNVPTFRLPTSEESSSTAADRTAELRRQGLLLDVNLRAVLHLCRLVLPGMVSRDRGHVVNISSIAGAYNFGGNSTYHATKAAVSMLSRQLRIDAFGKRVRVTEICPGRVATEIFAHVHGDSKETRERFVEGFELPQAADIADAIAFAIAAPIAVNVGHMEITPTLQVPGGLSTARPERPQA